MKLAGTAALTLAMLAMAAPASAQERSLTQPEIELLAEMLAMGDVCADVADFRVYRDSLHGWMTGYLAQVSDSDLDTVLELRDTKQNALRSNVAELRTLPQGNNRQEAIDNHYAGLTRRCLTLSENALAEDYFIYR